MKEVLKPGTWSPVGISTKTLDTNQYKVSVASPILLLGTKTCA